MRKLFFCSALILLPSISFAQDAEPCAPQFVGTWKLVANYHQSNQSITYLYGKDAKGYIDYDANGRMSVQMMRTNRLKNNDINKDYFAYFGTYAIDCKAKIVHHFLLGSLNENDVGKERDRRFKIVGNKLYLYPVEDNTRVVVWERLS